MAEAAHIEFNPLATGSRRRQLTSKTIIYLCLTGFALMYLLPVVIIFLNTLRPLDAIVREGFIAWPESVTFSHWAEAWGSFCIGGTCEGVSRFYQNSLMMAVPATILSTAIGLVNGYILSKWRFKGANFIFGVVTLGVFLLTIAPAPGEVSEDAPALKLPEGWTLHREKTAGQVSYRLLLAPEQAGVP